MIGFELHSSKKWQAARAAFVSVFAFVAICAITFSDVSESKSLLDILMQQPALGIAALLFLIFSIMLMAQLYRVLTTRLVLEFTDSAIVDRRRRRVQMIPYSAIDVFSPLPEELFPTAELAAKLRDELGLDEFVSISCRLRVRSATDDEGFVFFEKVKTPAYEVQKQIIARLRDKISRFEDLVYDDGTGFGDDDTNT